MSKRRRPPRPKNSKTRKDALAAGFRSGMEKMVAGQLTLAGVPFEYETMRIPWVENHYYKPDFILPNGVILEVKGRFTGKDRAKHLKVRKQHPEWDIRFVFQIDNTLTKASDTRYSEWCDKHGFEYCFVNIPPEWYKEDE